MSRQPINVIFDLGRVLLRWEPLALLESFYDDPALRVQVLESVFQHTDWLELDRGTLTDAAAIRQFHQRTGRPEEELRRLFLRMRQSLTPIEASWQLLHELSAAGHPLYCLSNMATATYEFVIQSVPRFSVFDGVVISGQVGQIKPEREIFEHLVDEHNLSPGQSLFIDDHLPNIEAATDFGLQAVHFTTPEQCVRDVRDLLTHR